jgi:hypothetical protein
LTAEMRKKASFLMIRKWNTVRKSPAISFH